MNFYSKEQIERANSRRIADYFAAQGHACETSRGETHIRGFGGFYVEENTQKFNVFSTGEHGRGLINCIMQMCNLPFTEAVKEALDGEMGNGTPEWQSSYTPAAYHRRQAPAPVEKPKREFEMPERNPDNKRVFMYLTQTRCIDRALVNEFLNSGLLYQDKKGNAVYLHTDDNGQPCGAELHGTGAKTYQTGNIPFSQIPDRTVIRTEPYIAEMIGREFTDSNLKFAAFVYEDNANIAVSKSDEMFVKDVIEDIKNSDIDRAAVCEDVKSKLKGFKGVAAGTSDSFFSYSRGNPQKAYVFESSIDLMSFMALHPDLNDCKFVAMAGLKPFVVEKLLNEGIAVSLCVDNDSAGNEFCKQFSGKCTRGTECIKSGVKDFNDLLKAKTLVPFQERVAAISAWADKSVQKINQQMTRKVGVAR